MGNERSTGPPTTAASGVWHYGLEVRSSSQNKIIHFLPKNDIILLCGPPAGVGFGFFDLAAEASTDGFESTREGAQKRQVHAKHVNEKSNFKTRTSPS